MGGGHAGTARCEPERRASRLNPSRLLVSISPGGNEPLVAPRRSHGPIGSQFVTRTSDMQSGVYEFLPQDRVIYGRPAADAVVETTERLARQRILIVASKTLQQRTDVVGRVAGALGPHCV